MKAEQAGESHSNEEKMHYILLFFPMVNRSEYLCVMYAPLHHLLVLLMFLLLLHLLMLTGES